MKLLLTSNGLANYSIVFALSKLVGVPFSRLQLTFIPTAANVHAGDKGWLLLNFKECHALGCKVVDVVDISALPKTVWEKRLLQTDILFMGGGNAYYLLYWLKKSGLADLLPQILERMVYVGVSAGSMVATPNLWLSTQKNKDVVQELYETVYEDGLNLVPFFIQNHINKANYP